MQQASLLEWKEAEQRRDIGMERAINHAERVREGWKEMALAFPERLRRRPHRALS